MKTRIGLAVAHGSIRAVLVRGDALLWAGEDELDDASQVAEAVARLLHAVPGRRWRRHRVNAAVGPTFAQLRSVSGLPPITDASMLARLVQQGATRFFLRNGAPLITTGVQSIRPGSVWVGAFDEPIVRAVVEGCRRAGIRLGAVTPSLAAIAFGLEGDEFLWPDGPVTAYLKLEAGQIVSVRRRMERECLSEEDMPVARQALTLVQDRAWRFADAYGAAVLPVNAQLVVHPTKRVASTGRVPHWRLAVALVALTLGTTWALLAPGLAAERASRDARRVLAVLSETRQAATLADADLRSITSVLNDVARFDAARRSALLLLSGLTKVLPERSALLTLRTDSAGGTLVALAPRAAQVVTPLERMTGITRVQIVGPVTREVLGTQQLERITLQFRFVKTEMRAGVDAKALRPDAATPEGRL